MKLSSRTPNLFEAVCKLSNFTTFFGWSRSLPRSARTFIIQGTPSAEKITAKSGDTIQSRFKLLRRSLIRDGLYGPPEMLV